MSTSPTSSSLQEENTDKEPTREQALTFEQQYVKRDVIGHGAFKTVHRAYDSDEGIEVAWNEVRLQGVKAEQKAKILGEITILEQLEHENIMRISNSWESSNGEYLVFITEIMSSGTLKDYVRDASKTKLKTIKKWCRQILYGLDYLHRHDPPIIHRDLKCDNIFIHGSKGEVKIGDLGLSICMKDKKFASSVIGTPEFMAPELYEEKYDSKVDIYAFGMCVLEMVTGDYPYSECENAAQVYKKVSNGIRPQGVSSIKNEATRDFVLSCIEEDPKDRPSASELLNHPWMLSKKHDDLIFVLSTEESPHTNNATNQVSHITRHALDAVGDLRLTENMFLYPAAEQHSELPQGSFGQNKPTSMPGDINITETNVTHAGDLSPTLSLPPQPDEQVPYFVLTDNDGQDISGGNIPQGGRAQDSNLESDDSDAGYSTPRVELDQRLKTFVTEDGERERSQYICGMRLYLNLHGDLKEIKFPFNIEEDTPEDVASEMMSELELSKSDCEHIARGIRQTLANFIPDTEKRTDPNTASATEESIELRESKPEEAKRREQQQPVEETHSAPTVEEEHRRSASPMQHSKNATSISSVASTSNEGIKLQPSDGQENPVTQKVQLIENNKRIEPQSYASPEPPNMSSAKKHVEKPQTDEPVKPTDSQSIDGIPDRLHTAPHKDENSVPHSRITSNQSTTTEHMQDARRSRHDGLHINTQLPVDRHLPKEVSTRTEHQESSTRQQLSPTDSDTASHSKPQIQTGSLKRSPSMDLKETPRDEPKTTTLTRQFMDMMWRHEKEEKEIMHQLQLRQRSEIEEFRLTHSLTKDTIIRMKSKTKMKSRRSDEKTLELASKQLRELAKPPSALKHKTANAPSDGISANSTRDVPPSPKKGKIPNSSVFNGLSNSNNNSSNIATNAAPSKQDRTATTGTAMTAKRPKNASLKTAAPVTRANHSTSATTPPSLARTDSAGSGVKSPSVGRKVQRAIKPMNGDGLTNMISKNLDLLGSFSLASSNNNSTLASPTTLDTGQQQAFSFGSSNAAAAQDNVASLPIITSLISKKIAQSPPTQNLLNLEVQVANNNASNIDNLLGEEVVVQGNGAFIVESIEKEKAPDETTLLSFDIVRTSS